MVSLISNLHSYSLGLWLLIFVILNYAVVNSIYYACLGIGASTCFLRTSIHSAYIEHCLSVWGFPGDSDDKESACNVGDPALIPGSGRSSGEGNGNPLQYSCLGNSMDRAAWQATVHGVAKSRI
ncbi:unnamed protein product [Rangifer tarandus platyrhynchus]|uniref:Uncharacterized protein n=2 Tax=Rangifer tarandus platyrhynchus TaxID=3082113 RepID=A0AC59YPC7_RANTA|nr:unnamed protein product [Rangifer tarandus platyrhynchus]